MKLVTANLRAANTQYTRLFDMLDEEQPDIVVLQEVSPDWANELVRLTGTYPHSVVEARDGNFGIALLARFPLASAATVDSSPFDFPTIIATLDVRGVPLQMIATHPMIPVGRRNFDGRNEQLVSVAEFLRSANGRRVLVGDLNTSMWDVNYRFLEARTGLRNVRSGFGVMPTWPTFLPFAMIPIDHVLVSSEVGVRDLRTGSRIGSDHLPLVATISL